jgi:hypothetical protein
LDCLLLNTLNDLRCLAAPTANAEDITVVACGKILSAVGSFRKRIDAFVAAAEKLYDLD